MRSHRLSPLLAGAILAASASTALALPAGWDPPQRLSDPARPAYQPWSAANAKGDLVVAWRSRVPGGERVDLAIRPAGGSKWIRQAPLGPRVQSVQGLRVAIGASGRVLVGWRTKQGRTVVARAAVIARSGAPARRFTLGPAKDAAGAVNVTIATPGIAAVTWVATGAESVNRPGARLGRAMVAVARATGRFGPARLLDRSTRPAEGFCADDSDPGLASDATGAAFAWWDCDEDIRDYSIRFARIGQDRRIGPVEDTGTISRGPTTATLLDAGGAVLGVLAENNDTDFGDQLRALSRTSSGTWSQAPFRVAGVVPDQLDLPYVTRPPRLAREPGGTTLAAWVGFDGEVSVAAGPDGASAFAPAVQVGPAARFTELAGAGVTTAGSRLTAWSSRTTAGSQERTIWSVLRLAADVAFPAPVDSLRVPILVGEPSLALGTGGRGVIAFSEGPKARASVRASTLTLP